MRQTTIMGGRTAEESQTTAENASEKRPKKFLAAGRTDSRSRPLRRENELYVPGGVTAGVVSAAGVGAGGVAAGAVTAVGRTRACFGVRTTALG